MRAVKRFYKVVSDGTSIGTKIYDPDGRVIPILQKAVITVDSCTKECSLNLAQLDARVYVDILVPSENVKIRMTKGEEVEE